MKKCKEQKKRKTPPNCGADAYNLLRLEPVKITKKGVQVYRT